MPLLSTLGVRGRALAVLPGLVAAAAGHAFGMPVWSSVMSFLLFLVPVGVPGIGGTLALLIAPLVFASGAGLSDVTTVAAVPAVALAVAAATPLFLHLGGAFPMRALVPFVAMPALLLLGLRFAAPAEVHMVFFDSDIAARLQLLVLVTAVALVDVTSRLVERRRKDAQPQADPVSEAVPPPHE